MPTTLLVTIDTEEEFDWSAPVSPQNRSVRHAVELPRLQDLFEQVGARPTYVVDHPIATTDTSVDVLKGFLDRGACEIGAHLHPWVNPPVEEEICGRNTYLCNLPLELQERKLDTLTEAIRQSFGVSPTTFKAGRYGIDFALTGALKRNGYTVDTSVIPYLDFSDDQGPDFSGFQPRPFALPDESDGGGQESGLLEVPCTVGFTRRPFTFWSRWHRRLSAPAFRPLRPIGIMWRTGLLRKVVLTPEGTELEDQIRLMRVMSRDEDPVLNVTLHSPTIQPGNTPYVNSADELERFLTRLRETLKFAIEQLGATCMTHAEYAERFACRATTV